MNEQKNTEQEVQAPIRYKLEGSVINDIKTEIYSILRKNNLSIRQVRSVLSVLVAPRTCVQNASLPFIRYSPKRFRCTPHVCTECEVLGLKY